jgi:hypothetical protein
LQRKRLQQLQHQQPQLQFQKPQPQLHLPLLLLLQRQFQPQRLWLSQLPLSSLLLRLRYLLLSNQHPKNNSTPLLLYKRPLLSMNLQSQVLSQWQLPVLKTTHPLARLVLMVDRSPLKELLATSAKVIRLRL